MTRPPAALAASGSRSAYPCLKIAFESLDHEEREALAHILRPRSVGRRQLIFIEGEPAESLFVVRSGTVEIYKLLADGRRQVIGFLFEGDLVGVESDQQYLCNARAVTRVSLCSISWSKLQPLLEESPHLLSELLRATSHELAEAEEHMLLLGRQSAQERLASFLLRLALRLGRAGPNGERLNLPMTRGDIADYLGLTVETVSRTFTQLSRSGVLRLSGRGGVEFVDRPALESLAEGCGALPAPIGPAARERERRRAPTS